MTKIFRKFTFLALGAFLPAGAGFLLVGAICPVAAQALVPPTDEQKLLVSCEAPVYTLAFAPEGTTLAAGLGDGTIRVLAGESGEELGTLRGQGAPVRSVAFSPDGRWLASGAADGWIVLLDAITAQVVWKQQASTAAVLSLGFSADGAVLVSGSAERKVRLWDAATGEKRATLTGAGPAAAVSPTGGLMVTGGERVPLRIWDVASGKPILTFRRFGATALAFAPSGKSVVCGYGGGIVEVWDIFTLEIVDLDSDEGWAAVTAVTFSPGGEVVACGYGDEQGTVRLFHPATGDRLCSWAEHGDAVTAVAFSLDGRFLASAALDGTIILRRVEECHRTNGREEGG